MSGSKSEVIAVSTSGAQLGLSLSIVISSGADDVSCWLSIVVPSVRIAECSDVSGGGETISVSEVRQMSLGSTAGGYGGPTLSTHR